MKRIILLMVLFILGFEISWSQKNLVISAWNYLKYNELDKAKDAIDKASLHETTINMAKTWHYRGLIYHKISVDTQFRNLSQNAIEEAYSSFKKGISLDTKSQFTDEAKNYLNIIAIQLYNKGVMLAKENKFENAIKSFNLALEINPSDTLSVYNSAYAAFKLNDKEKAKNSYYRLIDMKYNDPKIYHTLSEIHKSDKDTAKALEIIRKGREIYPKNSFLIIDELNIYLSSGKHDEAKNKLYEAISLEPDNPTLHFALGRTYETAEKVDSAELYYKKAIAIDNNYFKAIYNLGALYFNKAVVLIKESDNVKDPKKFEEVKMRYEAEFNKALPYLERALQLDDKDYDTLVSLKQLYARMGNFTKSNEMKKRIEEL